MNRWELKFEINEADKVYAAAVPEAAQPLLEEHPYLGISWTQRGALQFFSMEEAGQLGEKIMSSDSERGVPVARLFFRYMEMMTGPETVQIPFGLAAFLHMDEWETLDAVLAEDEEGRVLLQRMGMNVQAEESMQSLVCK